MNEYCKYCTSILSEYVYNNKLSFDCVKCGNTEESTPEQTLRLNVDLTGGGEFFSVESIVTDPVNTIIDIDCDCGGKLGTMRSFGENNIVIKVCQACSKQI